MVKFLIQRPVAVITIFSILIVTGMLLLFRIPVSLLPNIDVPQILVKINYPQASASVVEENFTKRARESLAMLRGLKHIESQSSDNLGLISLTFDYSTPMNTAYLSVTEKLDRLAGAMPPTLQRPEVIRLNTSDIPVMRLQVIPSRQADYLSISDFTEKILKRRLEQIEGVSLVDIHGLRKSNIIIRPNRARLLALGLREQDVVTAVRQANREMSSLSVRDGFYRYFVKVNNNLDGADAIARLPIRLENGAVISLDQVANVEESTDTQTGYHFYNGSEALVVAIHKQPDSRMTDVVERVREMTTLFTKDYPQARFELTQDQSFLMNAGIDNLYQDLFYGGGLTVLLLFLFLGNWQSPLLMSINIPISLAISVVFFYLFNISFNIISLSGLTLGIGMLIDNSIVVIDSITREEKKLASPKASAIAGTNSVIVPVISQVLTTVAVYAPLILLSGIAGALFFDQSIALTISLGVSLLVAFILTPLLYAALISRRSAPLKDDTWAFRAVSRGYHKMVDKILRNRRACLLFTLLLMPLGILLAWKMPVSALPHITSSEALITIDWNEPIDAKQNAQRVKSIYADIGNKAEVFESEIGIRQFLMQNGQNTLQRAEIYIRSGNEQERVAICNRIRGWARERYPMAELTQTESPNAFTQLFDSGKPYFEARFRPLSPSETLEQQAAVRRISQKLAADKPVDGKSLRQESSLAIVPDYAKMALYGISRPAVEEALFLHFGDVAVSDIRQFGIFKRILLQMRETDLGDKLAANIPAPDGTLYPLHQFISVTDEEQPAYIFADSKGIYQSLLFDERSADFTQLRKKLEAAAASENMKVSFSGLYFENSDQLKSLLIIFLTVLLLLFFILAIQYESLVLPLIIMMAIPLGITGGMILLWAAGGTLNVMSATGFIVILGLIVDDPILKLETLNRLEKKYMDMGAVFDERLLGKMIHEAGSNCLKPLLMVSLTTSVALVPVLFSDGIGNELQLPLALVIIGGLTFGTFFTTWFIPLAYWYYMQGKHARKRRHKNTQLSPRKIPVC